MSAVAVARAQGLFHLVGGGWPLLHLRSFEWVFGPKTDVWLQRATAGLLATTGWSLLRTGPAPESLGQARRAGVGSAVTLLAVDLVYVPLGRIRPTYLLDAAMQAGWLAAWWRCGRPRCGKPGGKPRSSARSAPRPR
ncbi:MULTISPECIES: hypothetical protein [Streptomyces]|uniref:Uncharacterized protein n=1 Tax=Streptomyces canarius TaxID=285453 RepID=A0ABQ3CN32_9ACTN|nr:hypothetical protein [Streptomyces canarius]GHA31467.1 hypothetical protein GCM10010345_40250 [Streptomyces canarius]